MTHLAFFLIGSNYLSIFIHNLKIIKLQNSHKRSLILYFLLKRKIEE